MENFNFSAVHTDFRGLKKAACKLELMKNRTIENIPKKFQTLIKRMKKRFHQLLLFWL